MVSKSEGLQLVGGRPCLDFINTEGAVRNGPPERIESYADLLGWSAQAGVLNDAEANRLAAAVREEPEVRAAVFGRAVRFREALYGVFAATILGEPASSADRAVLDAELGTALSHRRLVAVDGEWTWSFAGEGPDIMLWRLAVDASDLLTSTDLDRVRECSGDTCSWLFLDRSRNRSRRWCDMADCGNRAKARRHYSRLKAGS